MVSILRNRAYLWSESVGEKATAVAASAVFMVLTDDHFPSWFFQILTYSVTLELAIPSEGPVSHTVLSREAVAKTSPSADQAQSQMILACDLSAATDVYCGSMEL